MYVTAPSIFAFLLFLVVAGSAYAVDATGEEVADAIYPVTVTVTEAGNRTLVASVRDHRVVVDQPRHFGADDKGPTPPEMLAVSFGTCIAATLQLVALREKVEISGITVRVEGSIDFSKALGISEKNRAGFQNLTATIDFESSLDHDAKKKLVEEVGRIGAALDNIENGTPVTYQVQ